MNNTARATFDCSRTVLLCSSIPIVSLVLNLEPAGS